MQNPNRWKNLWRGMLLVAAMVGVAVPAAGWMKDSTVMAQKPGSRQLPPGISVAGTQTSWPTLFASIQ